MSDVKTTLEIELRDEAAAGLERLRKSFDATKNAYLAFAKAVEKGISLDPTLKRFVALDEVVLGVGNHFGEIASKAKAFGSSSKAAATEATAAFKELDAQVRRTQSDIAKGATGSFGSGATSARATRERVTGEARARRATRSADAFDFSSYRTRERIKAGTRRQEERATRDSERAVVRADKAHLAGITAVNREHARGRAARGRAARHIGSGARESIRSLDHGFGSPAVTAAIGLGIGAAITKHVMSAAEQLDDATTRYRMLAVPAGADAGAETSKARSQALRDSIGLGVDAGVILDVQAKAIRDGVAPEIARSLPKAIASAAHVMAASGDGNVEALTDKLAETVQQASAMGLIKTPAQARSLLNVEAGISNFAGNSSEKMEQFVSGGALGRGREMGLSLGQTMEYGALLNSSGARTGLASARFMGQLSQNVPVMRDKFRAAQRQHTNTDEGRAIRSAPGKLGYGSINEMQKSIMAGPEGLADFAERLRAIDDKTRKLILKGYGFSEQGGAMLAEITPAKAKSIHDKVAALQAQKEDNDYLSSKFADWQTGLVFMLKQIEAGWKAIEAELGDVIKTDIIAPFRDWWTSISEALLNSDMKAKFHQAILGFVHGMGFDDVAGLLRSISGSVGHFDIAGFATGVGEGIANLTWAIKGLFNVLSFGSGDAETIGKIASELFGLSLAAMVMAPIIGIISAFAGALKVVAGISELAGFTGSLKAFAVLDFAGAASGLAILAGSIGLLVAAVAAVQHVGALAMPKDLSARSILNALDPNFGDLFLGKQAATEDSRNSADRLGAAPAAVPSSTSRSYWEKKSKFLHRESFDGGDQGFGNLLQNASYDGGDIRNDGSADEIKGSLLGTERAVRGILDAIQHGGSFATKASLIGGTSFGDSSSGFGAGLSVSGGGTSNMRYGRGSSGAYRGTPGTGGYGTPSKSLLDFIAQSEGGGYNTTQGNGKYLPGGKEQVLTGKSLNEILALGKGMIAKSGSSAMGRYQITGGTIRDLMGRMHLNGSEKYDEKMQDAMASKLIADEGPRALNRWEGLKRGGRMATARGLLGSGSIASIPSTGTGIMGGGGSVGAAVDHAMRLQGAGEAETAKALGKHMSSGEWCADFVNGVFAKNGVKGTGSSMANSFNKWGRLVDPHAPRKGDVVTENRGGNSPTHHVGIATGEVHRGKDGVVDAIGMISGNYGHQVRHNMERLGIIQGLHRGAEDAPAASRLPPDHQSRPSSGGDVHHHGAPTIHVNGSGNPHVVAGLVAQELHRHQQGRLSDSVAVV